MDQESWLRRTIRLLACAALVANITAVPGKDAAAVQASTILAVCDVPLYYRYQISRYTWMREIINQASWNQLPPGSAPTYDMIARGYPNPTYEAVSYVRPIPQIILRAMAWQESHWLQFAATISDPDEQYALTLRPACGYGVMQIDWCMQNPPLCPWLDVDRVSAELPYNIGSGTDWLIRGNWNPLADGHGGDHTIGGNDHTAPEDWYYAVTSYNGWSEVNNDPNRLDLNANRVPYGDPVGPGGPSSPPAYPYQEYVWGLMAHPEVAVPPAVVSKRLWRPTQIATVPRGIWGLSGTWEPPTTTPKPVFFLLSNIVVSNDVGPIIELQNGTGDTLAADVIFYYPDGRFKTRWLHPGLSYIRVNPNSTVLLPVAEMFLGESFTGYARVHASLGVDVRLRPPTYANRLFLPSLSSGGVGDSPENCFNIIGNGGFEDFEDGRPTLWTNLSQEEFSLADGTWFRTGHYGAYLGGFDDSQPGNQVPNDILQQNRSLPSGITAAHWSFWWYMRSEEDTAQDYDTLYIRVRDPNNSGSVLYQSQITNRSMRDTWVYFQTDLLQIPNVTGRLLTFAFESSSDTTLPTSFFIDDVQVTFCY